MQKYVLAVDPNNFLKMKSFGDSPSIIPDGSQAFTILVFPTICDIGAIWESLIIQEVEP